jgi:hypothetical protein
MKELVVFVVTAALAPGLLIVGHWTVGQLWLPAFFGRLLPTLGFLLGFPLVVFGILAAAVMGGLFTYRRQWVAARLVVAAIPGAMVGAILVGNVWSYGMKLRMQGFGILAVEARPLVAAITRYHVDVGHPPASLGILVPTYLPKLPRWVGRVQYIQPGHQRYPADLYGNPWILRVNAAWGMGFDSFVYFPNGQYPSYERVHDWAYEHE